MAFTLALQASGTEGEGAPPQRGKALGAALVDVVAQQLDSAIAQIERTADPNCSDKEAAVAVHEARKALKRTRAALRLLRRSLGQRAWKSESQRVAAVGRLLSETREAQVMDQVLRDLARLCRLETPDPSGDKKEAADGASAPPQTPDPTPAWSPELRAGYAEAVAMAQKVRKERPKVATRPSPELRAQVLDELRTARARLAHFRLRGKAKRSLRNGLRRAARQVQSACAYAYAAESPAEQSAERFHELRKRVKDLYYMACLLTPAQPALLEPLAAKLDELADLLGDDHDLAVLIEQAHAGPEQFGAAVPRLVELAAAQQRILQQKALPLTASLNELGPRCFARTIVRGLLPRWL